MGSLEISLPSRNYGWSRGRKWDQSSMLELEISLYLLLVSHILSWWNGTIWVKFSKLKLKFKVARERPEVKFSKPLKHRYFNLTQVALWLVKRQKLSSKCDSRIWIIALSTSSKSLFGWSKDRNWVQSGIWALETSLFLRYASCFLGSLTFWRLTTILVAVPPR